MLYGDTFLINCIDQFIIPLCQLLLALILGATLGVERTFARKTAGMRTFGMVAMGSCLFIIISQMVGKDMMGLVQFDPMRLAAGIVTGIGFLGAGLIIFRDKKVSGLTTAAGLWVSSGIGIAVGFGLYGPAIIATILTFINFTFMWYVESKVKEIRPKRFEEEGE